MSSLSTTFSLGTRFATQNPPRYTRYRTPILRRSFTVLSKLNKSEPSNNPPANDDFITKVLKQNPSQVEPRYLVGDKLYNLKEREELNKSDNTTAFEFIKRKFDSKTEKNEIGNDSVYLSDLLREYKGKLYVPEQVFGVGLSEEEEFERTVKELPKLSLEDFRKAMKSDKVKMVTSKEGYTSGYRDFIVDLKEIPGVKSLQRTKWAMKLGVGEAQELLKEYNGPQYEIERHMTVRIEFD